MTRHVLPSALLPKKKNRQPFDPLSITSSMKEGSYRTCTVPYNSFIGTVGLRHVVLVTTLPAQDRFHELNNAKSS